MKKSSKQFVISTEAKNANGFRVRTAGIDLVDYNANPLMLWMHKRPTGESKDEVLPPGNMIDLNFTDKKLFGTPSFDEDDAFALSLYNKYENGTLRALSPGLIPLKWGKDENGDVWLEKSRLKEVSLVDIGSNAEALGVTLYNEADELVTLSLDDINTIIKPENKMKTILLSAPALLPMLQLAADATPEAAQEAIGNLVTLTDTQAKDLLKLKDDYDALELKYNTEVKLAHAAKITALLNDCVAKGKFVEGDRAVWLELAEKNFDGTKAALESMPANQSVMEQLKDDAVDDALLKLSWNELDKKDLLVKLKAENLPVFKEKYKAQFGNEYVEN